MLTLEQVVETEVKNFITDSKLFTALDISNNVKEVMPNVRHRMVRDVVRNLWSNLIELSGYGRTPISVTLSDGSLADALLYHPLSDSWDLDAKYDAQKRNQSAATPLANNGSTTQSVPVVTPVTPVVPVTPVAPVVQAVSAPVINSTKDLWDNLFNSQPSLFAK